jgi:hypothetical protein
MEVVGWSVAVGGGWSGLWGALDWAGRLVAGCWLIAWGVPKAADGATSKSPRYPHM